jgi:hypothetical protein
MPAHTDVDEEGRPFQTKFQTLARHARCIVSFPDACTQEPIRYAFASDLETKMPDY